MKMLIQTLFFPFLMIVVEAEEEAGNPMVYPKVRPIPLVAVAVVADNPMIDVVVVVVVGNPMGHHGANDRRHHYHHPNAANAREDAGTPKYWAGSGNER